MKVSKIPGLGSYGIIIDGVDLHAVTDEEWMEIGRLHMKNLVTVIRNCNGDKDRQADLITKWGDTRYCLRAFLMKKYDLSWAEIVKLARDRSDDLSELDRTAVRSLFNTQVKTANGKDVSLVTGGYDEEGHPLGLFAEGELLWHSNESGTLTWVPGVALLAHNNVVGSATGFVTTPDYYENVSESFRSELNDMIIEHRFTPGKINPGLNEQQDAIMNLNMCPEDDTEVPLVIRSPGGITGLHYSINTVHKIKGMSKADSDRVFEEINKGLFTDQYIYDHWYQNNNDLMLFDNSITLHRRLGNIQGRMCYRIAHDYTNLQNDVYQPYFQKKYQDQYNNKIKTIVKTTGIKNFKLPRVGFIDRIKQALTV